MANVTQRSFAAGEVGPVMWARADLQRYGEALKTNRNAVVMRTGGLETRGGFGFCGRTKNAGADLAVFASIKIGADLSFVVEFGAGYVRFIRGGAYITTGAQTWNVADSFTPGLIVTATAPGGYVCILAHTGSAATEPGIGASWQTYWRLLPESIYEMATPYLVAELGDLQAQQFPNELVVVHPNHAPIRFTYLGAIAQPWTSGTVDWAADPNQPSNIALTGVLGTGVTYSVTRIVNGIETTAASISGEVLSLPQSPAAMGVALLSNPKTLTWNGGLGAAAADQNQTWAIYGTIPNGPTYLLLKGKLTYPSVIDNGGLWSNGTQGVASPPAPVSFSAVDRRPSAIATHQQRMLLGGSNAEPDVTFASQSGLPFGFGQSTPIEDSDALSWRTVGRSAIQIRHLISIGESLLCFTDEGIDILLGGSDGILRPGEPNPQKLSYIPCSNLRPIAIDDVALFVHEHGGQIYEVSPRQRSERGVLELSMGANHLLDGHSIVSWCFQRTPHSIVWMVRDDGVLLSLTYATDTDVIGWARHDTLGAFESVACIAEEGRDAVYAIVRRTVNFTPVRYVERLEDRLADAPALMDAFVVREPVAGVVDELEHLEGLAVTVVADGVIVASPNNPEYDPIVVVGGEITLPIDFAAASEVVVGLPYTSDIQTLDIESAGSSLKEGKFVITRVGLWLEESRRIYVGQKPVAGDGLSAGNYQLQPMPILDDDDNEAAEPITGYREVTIEGAYTDGGSIFIRNVDPVPLTIHAIVAQGHFPRG